MNKRIYELLQQCSKTSIDGEHHLPYVDQELFAQLVINECAQVCLDLQTPGLFKYKTSIEYSEEIKKHFGIK